MIFNKDLLQMIIDDDAYDYQIKKKHIISIGRWRAHYAIIFEDTTTHRFYYFEYDHGATELPEEYAEAEVDCPEVFMEKRELEVWVLPNDKVIL